MADCVRRDNPRPTPRFSLQSGKSEFVAKNNLRTARNRASGRRFARRNWLYSFGPSRDKDGNEKAEIYAIYVLPKFWHQGIGGELLEGAERRIKDNHFIAVTLWVLEKNALARQFYEARGFGLDAARKEETIGGFLLTELRYEKRMPN
jgi:GNAT superfamily N-acetyltransferase